MPMGRPRKPRAQKVLEGTFRKDRNPAQEPEYIPPTEQQIKKPAGLNRWARKFWEDHVHMLLNSGVLAEADMGTFLLMCQSWGAYSEAEHNITHDPETRKKRTLSEYMDSRGYERRNMPELVLKKESLEQFLKIARDFGMTPSSRNRIDLAPKGKETDPVEEMFKESNG
jgi:P27 family predicted phage terminase small subunit